MNSKRVFLIMVGVIGLLSGLAIVGVVLGSSVLQKQGAKLLDLKLQNKVLDSEQSSVTQANKDIQKYADLENIAKTIVPQDKDQANAVREIVSVANSSGVSIKAITFPSSTLGQAAAPAAGAGGTVKPTIVPNTSSLTQVQPVTGIPGVYSMNLTIQSDETKPISYHAFLTFLQKLEQNRRTAQVTSISIQPRPQNNDLLTFNVTVSLYIKPS